MADHFLAGGYRRFAFYGDLAGIWVTRRREGFIGQVEAAGYRVQVTPLRGVAKDARALAQWLQQQEFPLAVMVVHDYAATAIVEACRAIGRRVPEDVAVVGVNNDDRVCEVISPPLSSVPLNLYRIGYEAAALLDQIIRKQEPAAWSILVPPGELIVRGSSGGIASADPQVRAAVQLIRDGLAEGITTKQVVARTGLTRQTLNHRFTQALGRSVAAELRRVRIERARQLLSGSDVPMPEVARQAGFSSARQLSETFHHEAGLTPTAYRQRIRPRGQPG